jgi:hypothetical protein
MPYAPNGEALIRFATPEEDRIGIELIHTLLAATPPARPWTLIECSAKINFIRMIERSTPCGYEPDLHYPEPLGDPEITVALGPAVTLMSSLGVEEGHYVWVAQNYGDETLITCLLFQIHACGEYLESDRYGAIRGLCVSIADKLILTIEPACRFLFALNHQNHTHVALSYSVVMTVQCITGGPEPWVARCLVEDMRPLPGFKLTYGTLECFTALYVPSPDGAGSFLRSLFE